MKFEMPDFPEMPKMPDFPKIVPAMTPQQVERCVVAFEKLASAVEALTHKRF